MRMKKLILCTSLIFSVLLTSCTRPPQQTDTEPRIISTSVAICEIMDELEIDLVGVPESTSELPSRYNDIKRVGIPMTPDMEIVASLNPTAILSPISLQYDLKPMYDGVGINSIFVNLNSIEGMFQSVKDLGKKYDREEQAQKIIDENDLFMAEYNASIQGINKPRVLILMGVPGSYMVAGENSYIGNLVKLAGGENVYADQKDGFMVINPENMLERNPDMILRATHGMTEEVQDYFAKEFNSNDIWKHFSAVQNGKVYDLEFALFNMSANLRYADSLNYLKDLFYK